MGDGEAGVAGLPAAAPALVPALPPVCPPALSCSHLVSALPSRLVPTSAGHCLPPPAPLQVREELAAAEARRPAVIAAQPSLRLNLPEALQQAPPRLDMCSKCARQLEQVGRGGGGCFFVRLDTGDLRSTCNWAVLTPCPALPCLGLVSVVWPSKPTRQTPACLSTFLPLAGTDG